MWNIERIAITALGVISGVCGLIMVVDSYTEVFEKNFFGYANDEQIIVSGVLMPPPRNLEAFIGFIGMAAGVKFAILDNMKSDSDRGGRGGGSHGGPKAA